MPSNLQLDRRAWAIVILLAAITLNSNAFEILTPFWKLKQDNPLIQVYICAEQFEPRLNETARIGYFYQQPQPVTFFADKRSTPQLQLQYVLVPRILDSRPEVIANAKWVIGYFENKKLAKNQAQALAPSLGLVVEKICSNYVLFRRAE